MLKLGNKTAKTNPEKAQLFAESVERNFGIESHLFSKSQFDHINKFVEAHSYHFTPLAGVICKLRLVSLVMTGIWHVIDIGKK